MYCLALFVVILLYCEHISGLQFPLLYNNTYLFLSSVNNESNEVDTSNPFRFDFIDTIALIELWGYKGEKHKVTTEDGYIISIYRIIPKVDKSPPVLVMHGFLACSETFLVRGQTDLQAGYDVWVGNFRGNNNGKSHVNMTSNDENFWKFSFHEMGYYDMPAIVDYVLDTTGFSKLTLIGHSYANAITMIMTSMRPEYNDKINIFVGMAPFVFATHLAQGALFDFFLRIIYRYCNRVRKFEVLERRSINPLVRVCDILPLPCGLIYLFILGITDIKYDLKLVPVITGYYPAGTSIFNLVHLVDLYRLGRFCQYNFGRDENLIRYNSEEPPDYDLSRVTIPVLLYSGTADIVVDYRDVAKFEKSLSNLVGSYSLKSYNHFDFIVANDNKETFYTRMIKEIGNYQQNPMMDVPVTKRPPRSPG